MNYDFDYDIETNGEFMRECTEALLPTMVQMMVMEETADTLDESVVAAFRTLNEYYVGQGLISEAGGVAIGNQRVNMVRLNKEAQIGRLTSIIILKMARKDNSKFYKKYKLGQKIKKENMAEMRKRYGQKANKLAIKVWNENRKSPKAAAVTDKAKAAAKSVKR